MSFKHNPAFRRLWLARFVSFLGDSLALVALIVYVAGHTNHGFAVAGLLIAGDLAPTLFAPVTGTIADRVEPRTLMIVCEWGQALAVMAIVLALKSLAAVLVLVAVRSLLAHAFRPASSVSVRLIVDDQDLASANAALGLGTFGLEAVGAGLAAVLIPVIGTRGALLVDAGSFVAGALLLSGLPKLRATALKSHEPRPWGRDAIAGLRSMLDDRLVRTVVLGFTAFVAFIAMDDVVLAFLARRQLLAGSGATAVLYGGSGVGLLIGFVLLARARTVRPLVMLLAGFAVAGAGNLLTGLAGAVPIAFAMQAIRGIGTSAVDVGSSTVLQQHVPEERLGRTFANMYALVGLAAGVSYVAGGLLLRYVSARTTLVIAGAGAIGVACLASISAARVRHR